jgi:hypothetical protein
VSNEDAFYMKVVSLDGIYNFKVLNFSFGVIKMLKNNIKIQQHNNYVQAPVALEKSYLF